MNLLRITGLAAATALLASQLMAQYSAGAGEVTNFSSLHSKSNSSRSKSAQKTPGPGQTPTPTPANGQGQNRNGRNGRATPTPSPRTTARSGMSSGPLSRGGKGPGSSGPGAASSGPAGMGHLKEVPRAFLDAIKTNKVQYDEQELKQQPGVIIFNSRETKAGESKIEREKRASKESDSIAHPL